MDRRARLIEGMDAFDEFRGELAYAESALRQLLLQHLDVVVVGSTACGGARAIRQNNRGTELIQGEKDAKHTAQPKGRFRSLFPRLEFLAFFTTRCAADFPFVPTKHDVFRV